MSESKRKQENMPLSIPLEDNFTDIIAKAQRGLGFTQELGVRVEWR